MFNIWLPIAEIEFSVILLLTIGFCVGTLGGFFGVGGAWIVTPALNIFGFNMSFAIGTDLAHIFGKSIIATKKHGKGNIVFYGIFERDSDFAISTQYPLFWNDMLGKLARSESVENLNMKSGIITEIPMQKVKTPSTYRSSVGAMI